VAIETPPPIRLIIPADAALYREVRLEALKQHPEAFGSSFEYESDKSLAWFEDRIAQSEIFGAFVDGELQGTAGYRAQDGPKRRHKGLLWGMYVRPAARNLGLGRRLVEAVLKHASGHVELLQLAVVSENLSAQRLYTSLGFAEYGREARALKQNGRYYDEILMVRFLTAR
jgi:ribosomal protein S18 acetylase RimI-like enzyme